MKTIIIIGILFLHSFSQVVKNEIRFPEDDVNRIHSLLKMENGNILGVGEYQHNYNDAGWLICFDSVGNEIWSKKYGEDSTAKFISSALSPNGDIVIGGFKRRHYSSNSLYDKPWILKLDNNGDTIWTYEHGGSQWEPASRVNGIKVFSNTNTIIAMCESSALSTSGINASVICLDLNGNVNWVKEYFTGTTGNCNLSSIIKKHDGGFAMAGDTHVNEYGRQGIIINCDSNGDTIWTKTFGDSLKDGFTDLIQTSESGFIGVGHTDYPTNGDYDFLIMRIDKNGNVIWRKNYGGMKNDFATNTIVLDSDKILISGYCESESLYSKNISILCMNFDGDSLWSYSPHSDNWQYTEDVLLWDDTHLYICVTENVIKGDIHDKDPLITIITKEQLTPIFNNNLTKQILKSNNKKIHISTLYNALGQKITIRNNNYSSLCHIASGCYFYNEYKFLRYKNYFKHK